MKCGHGFPSAASCVDCMMDGPVVEPVRWVQVGDPFTARFDGHCDGCGEMIAAGWDRVQRWDRGDERTVYLHSGCVSAEV